MTISKALRDRAKLVVFTRNHKGHLDEAFRVSSADPDCLIPFRGVSRWSSAAQALQQHPPIDIHLLWWIPAHLSNMCEAPASDR